MQLLLFFHAKKTHLATHLIPFKVFVKKKKKEKSRVCECVATTGCQFEEWLVIVLPMGSVN